MPLEIDWRDENTGLSDEQIRELEKLLSFAADKLNVGDAELSLSFVDNETIRKINAQYRNKDQVTDVISFALEEKVEGEAEIVGVTIPRMLGDIIVSVPKAREQAEAYGHSFERELGFLVVHGLLHLLGYDHQTPAEEKEMFSLQEEILTAFGLPRSK